MNNSTTKQVLAVSGIVILLILSGYAHSMNGLAVVKSGWSKDTILPMNTCTSFLSETPLPFVDAGTGEKIVPSSLPIYAENSNNRTADGTTSAVSLPPQGLYESCLPEDPRCIDRLTEMGAKGFKVVLNDGLRYANSAISIRTYANHAEVLGMQVILPIKYFPQWDADKAHLVKEFPNLAHECGCTDNKSFLTYYINSLKNHPALWGYYIADEIHSEYYQGLSIYSEFVKNLDPAHPRLIVEEGTNDPMEIFFTFPSFMRNTTDVIALDNYPYGYIDTYDTLTRFTGESARILQYWSEKLKLKNAIVLQAYAAPQYYGDKNPLCTHWPDCAPFPSYDQMKAQRDQALQFSKPEIILWFSYPDILRSENPEQHWRDLVTAAFSSLPTPYLSNCPLGWECEDIGAPKKKGTQTMKEGVWHIKGTGWDIWSQKFVKADQFHYVWKTLNADGELSARIVNQANTGNSAKAGIMLRKTFDPVSPYYAIFVSSETSIIVQYRSYFQSDPVSIVFNHPGFPVYLKIVRHGSLYKAYFSTNAENWTQVPDSSAKIPSLDSRLMAGLAVTSRKEGSISDATFDHVSITTQIYKKLSKNIG
jgi:hypothetical protein